MIKDKVIVGGLYEHYKKKQYRVLGVAIHTETLEPVVYYEALYENDLSSFWVRPEKMFLESVEIDGVSVPRFKFIGHK